MGVDEVMKVVPESYLLGNPEVYKLALTKSFEGLSPNGLMNEKGPETALKALASYIKNFNAEAIDLSKCWTNDFAEKAQTV